MKTLILWSAVALAAGPAAAFMCGVSLTGGVASPFGDFAELAGASPVVDGRVCFCITPNWNASLGVGYRTGHKADEDFGTVTPEYQIIPVLVGGDYRFDFLPLMPYIGGGAAVVPSRATIPIEEGVVEERNSTRVGGYVEGGLEYYLGAGVGVDARGRGLYAVGGDEALYGAKAVDAGNYGAFDVLFGLFWYPGY